MKTYYYVLTKSHRSFISADYDDMQDCRFDAIEKAHFFHNELYAPCILRLFVRCKNGVIRNLEHKQICSLYDIPAF